MMHKMKGWIFCEEKSVSLVFALFNVTMLSPQRVKIFSLAINYIVTNL
jgi:hypothetical protein